MDFITLTETAGAAIVDVYNLALVKTSETGSKVELYKGDDLDVTETVEQILGLIAEAKKNALP
jgi:hypothetical protein